MRGIVSGDIVPDDFIGMVVRVVLDYRRSVGMDLLQVFQLADVLDEMNRWPDGPHFHDAEEADRYESRLFGAVSSCISPTLFQEFIGTGSYPDLSEGFMHFMLGMQAINVLMDRFDCEGNPGEDPLAGHFWLPIHEEESQDKRMAFDRVQARGIRSYDFAWSVFSKEQLPQDVVTYLHGMQGIFDKLIPVAKERWGL